MFTKKPLKWLVCFHGRYSMLQSTDSMLIRSKVAYLV